jgi:WD40 repeat protein
MGLLLLLEDVQVGPQKAFQNINGTLGLFNKRKKGMTKSTVELFESESSSNEKPPVLPLEVLVEHVAPFLDRTSFNNFSYVSKKVRTSLPAHGVVPPWPARLSSRDHMSRARVVKFSHSGSQLCCGCTDGKIRVWNVRSGEQKSIDAHWPGEDVTALAYSTDDCMLASASTDHTIKIWTLDPPENEKTAFTTFQLKNIIHSGHVSCLSFSYDNSLLIVGHHNREKISIYDVSTCQLSFELTGGNMPVASAQLTRNGRQLVSTCAAKQMKVWSLSSKECYHIWEGRSFSTVSVNDDHNIQIASIENQDKFSIWNAHVPASHCRRRCSVNVLCDDFTRSSITVETQCPFLIEFSECGAKVACADDFRGLLVYSTRDGKVLKRVDDTGLFPIHNLAFSHDGSVAVVSRMYNAIHLFYT